MFIFALSMAFGRQGVLHCICILRIPFTIITNFLLFLAFPSFDEACYRIAKPVCGRDYERSEIMFVRAANICRRCIMGSILAAYLRLGLANRTCTLSLEITCQLRKCTPCTNSLALSRKGI